MTSKAAAETLVLAANSSEFATCALRPSVLFGEGDYQLVPSVHACIAKWETPFVIGDGFNLWDASYAGNVADAHVLAVENLLDSKTAAGEAIFIANEEPITFRDFSLAVWRNFDHYPPFTFYIPKAVAVAVGFLAECVTRLTGTSTTISRGSVLDASAIRYCDGLKARRLLGYKPSIGIEEGLKRSCLVSSVRDKCSLMTDPTTRNMHSDWTLNPETNPRGPLENSPHTSVQASSLKFPAQIRPCRVSEKEL